jgi:FKBP-type peptidyl-prolyl cis-trans isomerase
MCVGETRKITAPSHLAFGEKGLDNRVPGERFFLIFHYAFL